MAPSNARKRPIQGSTSAPIPMDVILSTEIDAVAIVSPVWTHFELAKSALENGKHVFVEKPFTSNAAQGEELIDLAEKKNLRIMVDHTFLFTGAVKKIKQLLDEEALGKLYYYDSTRVNLGLFQHDVNVLWDLAPHDLSIMDYLIKSTPEAVVATGQRHLNGHEDVAFMTLYFPEKIIAHINVNWLSPVKIRYTLIGGEKKMVVWNDLVADEKLRVYDRGVNITSQEGVYDLLVHYRSGDMWAPQVEQGEALRGELTYFVDCISSGKDAIQRRTLRAAGGQDAGSGQRIIKDERISGLPMNSYNCISSDVKMGEDVRLSKFINLYGCEIGDETKIGAFVEIQKNARVGSRCKISSHSFICEGVVIEDNVFIGHGVMFINDSYPRATAADGRAANRGRLEGRTDGDQEGRIDRLRRHDSSQYHRWRERDCGRRQRGHQGCSQTTQSSRETRPGFFASSSRSRRFRGRSPFRFSIL